MPNLSPSPPGSRAAREGLKLSEAAAALGLSTTTVRRYVKAGKIKASQVPGKYGLEYRILPAVLSAFALETLDLNLNLEDVATGTHTQEPLPPPAPPEDVVELYERLLVATEEATRYKALAEVSESTYRAQIAELQQEKAELEKSLAEARRPWWRRLFGGAV